MIPMPPLTETAAPTRGTTPRLFDAAILRSASVDACRKLSPRHALRNPVMAVVWLGTVLTGALTLFGYAAPAMGGSITAVLALTVLFATVAEAMAEARGRGQAASLRRARQDLVARRLAGEGVFQTGGVKVRCRRDPARAADIGRLRARNAQ